MLTKAKCSLYETEIFGLFSINLTASGWISESVAGCNRPQVSSKIKCELIPLKQV